MNIKHDIYASIDMNIHKYVYVDIKIHNYIYECIKKTKRVNTKFLTVVSSGKLHYEEWGQRGWSFDFTLVKFCFCFYKHDF